MIKLPVRLVVIGAGLVGERHAKLAAGHEDFELVAIVDSNPDRQRLADELDCRLISSIDELGAGECDAAIVATPTSDHLPSGLACLKNSWPCLIEKPITDTLASAYKLHSAFAAENVPLLVGHHRRYHPSVIEARRMMDERELGDPVMASIIWAVRKPDDYFRQGAWRLNKDGGPLLINFIHEADLMLNILGPVSDVQAIVSSNIRGGSVEDTAAILLRFESGLLATVALTDAALTPWSFEGASNENPNIADTGVCPWRIGCTNGAFEFPKLKIWSDAKNREGDWSRSLRETERPTKTVNPLHEQLSHFSALVRGEVKEPMVRGSDGLNALRLVQAIQEAVETGCLVSMNTYYDNSHKVA